MTKTTPETEAIASELNKQKEDIVNWAQSASFSNFSEETTKEMSRLMKEIATTCSSNNFDIRILAEYHALYVGEDWSWKMDQFIDNIPYTLRSDWNDDHIDYDVFGWNNMNNIERVFVDVIVPEVDLFVL